MQQTPLLMSRLLDRGARVAPEEEIVTATASGTRRRTYRESRDRAHQLAHALAGAGIGVGDRVATLMSNGDLHVEAYHAIASMGAVLHPLNHRIAGEDLEYVIHSAGDRIILVDADLLPLLEKLAGRIPSVERVVIATEEGFERWRSDLPDPVDYEAFIQGKPTVYAWPDLDENAPVGLCHTSGTTGRPKGCLYTHRSQYLNTLAISMTDVFGLSATDSVCGIVPMSHCMGWGIPWAAMMLGFKLVLPHRFMEPHRLAALIASEEVSFAVGVPTIWEELRAVIEADRSAFDFSQARRFGCGGAAPPIALTRWYFDELGVELIQGFGMTESNAVVAVSRRVMKRSQRGSSADEQCANTAKSGVPLPGIDAEIVDQNFNPLPHDGKSAGEVLLRGPWIIDGYYGNPSPDTFHNGWLRTGDIAKIDADEYVIVSDRAKDLIKSGGEWISSIDLENEINAVDGVVESCVVAQPHPKWEERPVALVVVKPGATVTAEQVRTQCAKHFANWQLPDDILFVGSIPQNSTGKMDKKAVRERLKSEGYRLPDQRTIETLK